MEVAAVMPIIHSHHRVTTEIMEAAVVVAAAVEIATVAIVIQAAVAAVIGKAIEVAVVEATAEIKVRIVYIHGVILGKMRHRHGVSDEKQPNASFYVADKLGNMIVLLFS